MFKKFSFVFVTAAILAAPSSVLAHKENQQQIDELKRIIDAQSQNFAQSMSQIQQALADFQRMKGQIELNQYGNDAQKKLAEESQKRIVALEDKVLHLTTQLEEIKTAGLLKPANAKDLTDFQEYQKSVSKITTGQYQAGIDSLTQFIAKRPKGKFNDAASFWIAESHYQLKDFPKAILGFQDVIKKYPQSSKVPLSLLRQGLSFFEMQSFDESKAFLTKLISQYPQTAEASQASQKIETINQLLEEKEKQKIDSQT